MKLLPSTRFFGTSSVLTLGLLFALFGCDGSGGHDHDHDHDHDHAHGHVHTAPHGGSLVVLGDEFAHLEWLLDGATGALTIHVLDGEAVSGVRIAAETLDFEVKIEESAIAVSAAGIANRLSGETVGDTSTFKAQVPELAGKERFDVTLPRIIVRGVEFLGVSFSYPEGNEGAHGH